ncbi:MAG: glycosyltransferase [Nostoc sp. ChiQUE01a]|nr:glycosyltransferase [Nostoc sp. ChiQUE01a]
MTHFGILCPAAIGHLNPMCALGRELQRRGHRVTLFHIPDVQTKVQKAGLEFHTIGEAEFPLGSFEAIYQKLGETRNRCSYSLHGYWRICATIWLDCIQAARQY